jgi:hypothetical protein
MAAPQGRRARRRLLHEFWLGAALAIALGAMLPGCTARFGFMEPVIVEQPRLYVVPKVIERVKEVEKIEEIVPQK